MAQDESESILGGLRPEVSDEHTSFDAYHTAVKARLQELLASPNIGGLRSVVEALMNPESDIGDKDEYLLNVLTIAYGKGRDDEHMYVSGLTDNPDLKVIGNYRGLPPETEPSP